MSSPSKPRPFSFAPPTPPHLLSSFPQSVSSPPTDTPSPIQPTPEKRPEVYKAYSPAASTSASISSVSSATVRPTTAPTQAQAPLPSGRASLGDLPRPHPRAPVGNDSKISRRDAVAEWLDTSTISAPPQRHHPQALTPGSPAVSAVSDRDEYDKGEGRSHAIGRGHKPKNEGDGERGRGKVKEQTTRQVKGVSPRAEGEEGQSLVNPNPISDTKIAPSRRGLGQCYTMADLPNPTFMIAQQKGFRRVDDEEVASRRGKSMEQNQGDYDRDGETKGEEGKIFWRQTWFRWTMAALLWGVLCMVVGGTVGLSMK